MRFFPLRYFALFLLLFHCSGAIAATDKYKHLSTRIADGFYPTAYASLGTPLYQSLTLFESYGQFKGMRHIIREYRRFILPIYRHGMALSCMEKPSGSDYASYLKELRSLEAEKKRVMHHLTDLTMRAVDNDDYPSFKALVALPLDELLPTLTTRTKALNYYSTKPQSRIIALDALAAQERRRKAKRMKQEREAFIYEGRRDYELVQHLPLPEEDPAYCEDEFAEADDDSNTTQGFSALKKMGIIFKTLGVNFDPGLLEDYKTHKPPSLEDVQ